MTFLKYQSYLKIFFKNFKSCSLVNSDGALLYSKDLNQEILTTTRLVAFQIVKKYLKPKPQDLFILNDPENGGYHYSKPLLISCLTSELFLIWDESNPYIDFKIPPTPIFEKGAKNVFIWEALLSANKHSKQLENFFLQQKKIIDELIHFKDILDLIGHQKNQKLWLNASQEVFSVLFDNKSHGNYEAAFKTLSNQFVKLKFSAEEKQTQKLITLDFTSTSLATDMHTSSHVIESALIKKIIDFYQFDDFFTQSILDKIKVILPPKSIVSKPHPMGDYNIELQSICSQICEHNMKQLNSHTRKPQTAFEYSNFLHFEIHSDLCHSSNLISPQTIHLNNFEELINNCSIKILTMRKTENLNISFQVLTDSEMILNVNNNYQADLPLMPLKINNKPCPRGKYPLKKNDKIDILW